MIDQLTLDVLLKCSGYIHKKKTLLLTLLLEVWHICKVTLVSVGLVQHNSNTQTTLQQQLDGSHITNGHNRESHCSRRDYSSPSFCNVTVSKSQRNIYAQFKLLNSFIYINTGYCKNKALSCIRRGGGLCQGAKGGRRGGEKSKGKLN